MRQKGAGLGASTLEIDPNDSYKEAVRKSARARFEQLNWNDYFKRNELT